MDHHYTKPLAVILGSSAKTRGRAGRLAMLIVAIAIAAVIGILIGYVKKTPSPNQPVDYHQLHKSMDDLKKVEHLFDGLKEK